MKPIALLPASALALCAFCTAAGAMSTVPYSGQYPGTKFAPQPNIAVPSGIGPQNELSPYGSFSPYGAPRPTGQRPPRTTERFLNADPFDPNSVVNSFDRNRYANPYPYDPVYNPYGQAGSIYAPTAPNVQPGQGIPYRR